MEKFIQEFRRQYQILHRLPFPKKLEHIWRYYRFHIIVLVSLVIVAVSIVNLVVANQREVLISGMILNNATSQEGYDYLSEGYWEACGADSHQTVNLVTDRYIRFEDQVPDQDQAANLVMLSVMVSDRSLDYIITDVPTLLELEKRGIVQDLSALLPEERLGELDTVSGSSGIIGIRLDGTAFAQQFPFAREDSCILVVSDPSARDRVAGFLDYLLPQS